MNQQQVHQADFNVEFDGLAAGSFEVPLYRSLWSISNGHLLFSEGLSWAYLEHCDEAKKNLAMLAKAWNKYRMGIAQQFLRSHNMRLSHINSKFPSEILDLERITLDMCLSLLVLNRG